MANNDLRVNLIGDASKLTASLNTASSKLSAFGKKAKDLGKNLSLKLTLPIALAGGMAISSAAKFEKLQTTLNVLTGSVEKGTKAFKNLVKFSAKTPFQLDELVKANNTMMGFGISADDAAKHLQSIGDIAAVSGGDLQGITVAFSQVAASGRLMGQDLLQLINNGVPIIDMLSKSMGVAKSEIKEMVSQGAVTFPVLLKAFQDATSEGGKFNGGMETLSNTLSGLGSTLKDNLNIGLAELGKSIVEAFDLKEKTKQFIVFIQELTEKFKTLQPATKKTILIIAGIAAAIGPVLLALGTLITLAPAIGTAFTVMTGPVGAIVAALAAVAYVIVNNWKPIKKAVLDVANYFIDLYNESLGFRIIIETIGIAFKLAFIKVKTQMKLIYTVVTGVFKSIADVIGNFGTILKGVFTLDSDLIKIGVSEMTKSLKSGFDDIVKNVKVETDNATKESMKVIADGLNNIIGGKKPKIIIEAEVVTTGDSGTSGDTGTGTTGTTGISGIDVLKLKEATNKALLTSDAKRFAAELKATTAHYDNLITLNKGNADIVKQLEISKGEALAKITIDSNQKKSDLQSQIAEATAVTDEQRKNLEIQNTKDFYQTLMDEAVKFDLATDELQTARDAKVQEIMDNYNEKTNVFKEVQAQLIGAMQSGFGALGNSIAQSLGAGETALGTFAGVLIQTAMTSLSTSLAGTMGSSLEAGANTAKALGPIGAFVLPALLAGAAVAVKGAFGKIDKPKRFAKGGIVSTPTMGLMGEYPGARSNPEVIAPLDKLKDMIGDRGGSSVQVGGEFVLKGQDLIVALQRATNNRNRII